MSHRPETEVDLFDFRFRDPETDEWFYRATPRSWQELEQELLSIARHRGHPMELWAISRYDSDPTEPEKPWMDEDGKPLLPWQRIAVVDRAAPKWKPSFNGPSMGVTGEGRSWSVVVTTPPPSETFVVAEAPTLEEARARAEEWGGIEWTSETRGVAHFGETVSIEPSQPKPDEEPLPGIRWDELIETGAFEQYLGPALGLPINKFGEVPSGRRAELEAVTDKFDAWLLEALGRLGVEAYSSAGGLIYPSQVRTLATELEGGSALWMAGTARALLAMLRDLAPESAELSMGAAERRVKPVRLPIAQAKKIAARVERELIKPHAERHLLVGSIRRKRPDIGDIEFVVLPKNLEAFLAELAEAGFHGGERKQTGMAGRLPVEIYIAHKPDEFGGLVFMYTGDWQFNIAMRSIAQRKGWKLNQYGIWRGDTAILQSIDERDFFETLGVRYHTPEERSFAHRKKAAPKKAARRTRMGDDDWNGFWKEEGEEE